MVDDELELTLSAQSTQLTTVALAPAVALQVQPELVATSVVLGPQLVVDIVGEAT